MSLEKSVEGECKPRIVLVGAGRWGSVHARTVKEAGGVLAAVVDVRREAAERVARMHGARAYASLDEAVEGEELDAAIVAVPPSSLAAVAREALEHGLHVLVEKPVALDSGSVEELAGLASSRGLVAIAGYLLRFHPLTRLLAGYARGGGLTRVELYRVVGRPGYARSWPIDYDLAVHDIDLALYLLGGDARVLEARLVERGEGQAFELLLEAGEGARVYIYASDAVEEGVKYRVVRVFARRGILEAYYDENVAVVRGGGVRKVVVEGEKPLTLEHRAFYSLVCGSSLESVEERLGARPASLGEAARVLRVVEEARRKALG